MEGEPTQAYPLRKKRTLDKYRLEIESKTVILWTPQFKPNMDLHNRHIM